MEPHWAHVSTDRCVHELFETQVDLTPDAVAVIDRCGQLTYQDSTGERISWRTTPGLGDQP